MRQVPSKTHRKPLLKQARTRMPLIRNGKPKSGAELSTRERGYLLDVFCRALLPQ